MPRPSRLRSSTLLLLLGLVWCVVVGRGQASPVLLPGLAGSTTHCAQQPFSTIIPGGLYNASCPDTQWTTGLTAYRVDDDETSLSAHCCGWSRSTCVIKFLQGASQAVVEAGLDDTCIGALATVSDSVLDDLEAASAALAPLLADKPSLHAKLGTTVSSFALTWAKDVLAQLAAGVAAVGSAVHAVIDAVDACADSSSGLFKALESLVALLAGEDVVALGKFVLDATFTVPRVVELAEGLESGDCGAAGTAFGELAVWAVDAVTGASVGTASPPVELPDGSCPPANSSTLGPDLVALASALNVTLEKRCAIGLLNINSTASSSASTAVTSALAAVAALPGPPGVLAVSPQSQSVLQGNVSDLLLPEVASSVTAVQTMTASFIVAVSQIPGCGNVQAAWREALLGNTTAAAATLRLSLSKSLAVRQAQGWCRSTTRASFAPVVAQLLQLLATTGIGGAGAALTVTPRRWQLHGGPQTDQVTAVYGNCSQPSESQFDDDPPTITCPKNSIHTMRYWTLGLFPLLDRCCEAKVPPGAQVPDTAVGVPCNCSTYTNTFSNSACPENQFVQANGRGYYGHFAVCCNMCFRAW